MRKYKLTDFAVNYIDDILIYSKTFTGHIGHLERLMKAIKAEGFRLKFRKCTFASNKVKYLGRTITVKEILLAYFSKKLNNAQKKRKAISLECLAIREEVR